MNTRKNENSNVNGIKIQSFNTLAIFISSFIFVLIFIITGNVSAEYNELVHHTQNYVIAEENADMVTSASDYLTEQVRLYVENMDVKYAHLYFVEANETCRREKALDTLQDLYSNMELSDSLEAAIQASNALMEREIYSMKLISVANNYDMDSLPVEVQEVELTNEDAALDAEAMIQKARMLVFDEGYQQEKREIYGHLELFTRGILSELENRQSNIHEDLRETIFMQRILLSFLFIMYTIVFIGITWLVIKSLHIIRRNIENNTRFEATPAYEFNHLASVYNEVYEKNKQFAATESKLIYKAEHDPLTQLLNRQVFDKMDVMIPISSIALILIDLDYFKSVNDVYGHITGDRVLKKIAVCLKETFRSKDFLFRIGGDEFACIMVDIMAEQAHIIKEKVTDMNEYLKNPDDGLPPVSLSVGVALSDSGYSEELYKQADQALYYVKNNGRCGCHIYEKEQ